MIEMLNDRLNEALERIALNVSKPFCYSCYKTAPKGVCEHCRNDDLMRELDGVGVEFGLEWVKKHILKSELEPISTEKEDELFDRFIRETYGETTEIAWTRVDTAIALKQLQPVDYRVGKTDYFNEERVIFVDGMMYSKDEAEQLIKKLNRRINEGGQLELGADGKIKNPSNKKE